MPEYSEEEVVDFVRSLSRLEPAHHRIMPTFDHEQGYEFPPNLYQAVILRAKVPP